MNKVYELPPMLSGSADNQLRQLRDYLVRMARDLPTEAQIAQAVSQSVAKAKASGGGQDAVQTAMSQAQNLKALIIKTADDVAHEFDQVISVMRDQYVAISDYGSYYEQIETQVEQTARGTVEGYNYQAQIDALDRANTSLEQYLTQITGEIRRGVIIDPDTHEETIGIVISQELHFTGATKDVNGETYYYLDSGQTTGVYTSTGWQFWINGYKRAWLDAIDGMLHVVQIVVEDRLQFGDDWVITTNNGFGLRYIGS